MPNCPSLHFAVAHVACRYQSNNGVTVKNTGTTLQVNFEPGSNSITWAGQQLELLQYHFHTPSEHTVEGAYSSMEAHLVHRNKATGGCSSQLVALLAAPRGRH
jgi:carbonic anhydrase